MAQLRVPLVLILRFGHTPKLGRRATEKLLRVPHNPIRFVQGDGVVLRAGCLRPPVCPLRPSVRTVLIARENGCRVAGALIRVRPDGLGWVGVWGYGWWWAAARGGLLPGCRGVCASLLVPFLLAPGSAGWVVRPGCGRHRPPPAPGSVGWVWDVGPGLGVWVLGCLGAGLLGGCGVCAWVGWWCYGGVYRLVGGGVGRGGAGAAGAHPSCSSFSWVCEGGRDGAGPVVDDACPGGGPRVLRCGGVLWWWCLWGVAECGSL